MIPITTVRGPLMIGPDPPTQFILYVFYGFMTRDEADQGKRLTLF